MMTMNIKHFFAAGNTARGYASLLHSSLQGLESLYVLDGLPGNSRQELIHRLAKTAADLGQPLWMLHCASNPDTLDGWIAPELKVGLVTGEAFRGLSAQITGITVHVIDLEAAGAELTVLEQRREDILRLQAEAEELHQQAYAGFAEALRIHDDWEALYIDAMDFEAADRLAYELVAALLGDRGTERSDPRVHHRFLGAATPKGAVDFVPDLTEGLKRYFIKGRAGSGKSTLLRKIAAAAEERGMEVEVYHCGFDPNSLDMIVVREAGFAIFDSTAPHEYFPELDSDQIIDTYELCIAPGTDETHQEALEDFKARYAARMKQSIGLLAEAKTRMDALGAIYDGAIEDARLDDLREELQWQILMGAASEYGKEQE